MASLSWTNLWALVLTLLELGSLALIPYVVFKKRQPVSATAWILFILLVPIVGAFFFLVFGVNRIEKRKGKRREAARHVSERLSFLAHPEVESLDVAAGCAGDHALRFLRALNEFPATRGNEVQLYSDVNTAYRMMLDAIDQARHHVHLEYYIYQPDGTGAELRDLLARKAREGVQVRLIYDAVGSLHLNRRFLQPLLDAGGRVSVFHPVLPWKRRWAVNFRTHRKITVVDGRIAFTGGANIGDEYRSRVRHFGQWRDTMMVVRGPAVRQLQHVFAQDWLFSTGEELTATALFPDPGMPGNTLVDVVPTGPDQEQEVLHELLLAVLAAAHSEILVETCYFVPPESLLVALKAAAHRGVRVMLALPSISAHRVPLLAAQSYYEELADCGVAIGLYRPGLLHSKLVVVDDSFALVGSPNLDYRSLLLNFEISVVFYDRPTIQRVRNMFHQDWAKCTPLELESWRRRPMYRKFLESVCRLAAPVL